MSSTLIALAAVCATNPFRVAACAPPKADIRRKAIAVATALSLVAVGLLGVLSEVDLGVAQRNWIFISNRRRRRCTACRHS